MNSLKSICEKWVDEMADVIFEDFTIKVQGAIDNKINAVLEEAAGEMEAQVKRNQDKFNKTSHTSGGWQHKVDTDTHTAYIGNNQENAIWEEFGTGEHAIPEGGGGRKGGYWVFVKGEDGKTSKTGKSYTLEEAKRVMAILRSKGLEAYYTNGKKARRHFWKAYTEHKDKIIAGIQKQFKGL